MLDIPQAGSHQHHLGGFKIYIPRCQKLQEGDTGTRGPVGDPWILSSSVVALSGIQPDSRLPPATRVTSRPLPPCTGSPHQVFQASDPSLFLLSLSFLLSRSMSIASAWSAGAAYQHSCPYPAPSSLLASHCTRRQNRTAAFATPPVPRDGCHTHRQGIHAPLSPLGFLAILS